MPLHSYEDFSPIQLLLHNLDLLGFDPKHDASSSVFQNITFDTNLFTHQADSTNHRAFECISYFLFWRLDPTQTKVKFSSCWPINEQTASGRVFRMTAYQWFLELQDQGPLSRLPILHRSYFETCQGDTLTYIIMCFSVLVLQTVIDRDLADPKGRPIRLTPSYDTSTRNSNTIQVKRAPPTIPTGDPAAIEKQLHGAIQALAHYTYQQENDFSKWVERARGKAITLKQQIDSEKCRSPTGHDQPHNKTSNPLTNLASLRNRIATLRDDQKQELHRQQERQSDKSSQKKWTPLEEK
ncbi:HAUS augmin-like complex subunit 6 N-terminus-domain-containing protein [Absidia repens]|uniref:HAUS augmin-like complex subunit 6 N-terminus-domain-containing protein n=1 Tax=Absidia repens TaxID=90262 RepID=A0A1X2IKX9_9FUNG|nr:HAUS augmin-like complex subunit 6 N-terminus-domain-containing protein [Absidia repens]